MFRIFLIAIISLFSLFPFLVITTQLFGLNDSAGGVVSIILGWVILPTILLKLWESMPNLDALPINIDDPVMTEYIALAKAGFSRFIVGLNEGRLEAYVKFSHEFGGEIEHVWGLAHTQQGNHIIVSLASTPVGEFGEEVLERMQVPIDAIEDWMLVNAKGESQGGYTIFAAAKIYERDYGKLPRKYAKDLERFLDFTWKQSS